tara:strand:- start:212 stop:694 length:483 start_codon:yes stop_codon:yes gene_type:complete
MKLPVFEEIQTKDYSIPVLVKLLHKAGAGKTALYIHLSANQPDLAHEQADNIAQALDELGIHPKLPFPCYAISSVLKHHPVLTIIKLEQDLPSHFRQKTKRLKNKEQSLLNRVKLVADKLTNLDLRELDNDVKTEMKHHRKLYKLTKETHFLEMLLKSLK